jgi:hypothetical protein
MKELILTTKDVLLKLEQLEKKMIKHDTRLQKYDDDKKIIFEALKKLLNTPGEPRPRVGF